MNLCFSPRKTAASSSTVNSFSLQNYLKEFAQLHEEFKASNVAVYGVCAEGQPDVDRAIKDWELNYEASDTAKPQHSNTCTCTT